jgi:hypothetical protein
MKKSQETTTNKVLFYLQIAGTTVTALLAALALAFQAGTTTTVGFMYLNCQKLACNGTAWADYIGQLNYQASSIEKNALIFGFITLTLLVAEFFLRKKLITRRMVAIAVIVAICLIAAVNAQAIYINTFIGA